MSESTFGMNEMRSQEQLTLLLQNPIVKELIDILENEGSKVLKELDPSAVTLFLTCLKRLIEDDHEFMKQIRN